MFISYECKFDKTIYIIERNFADGSSSIIGCCSDEYEANSICHVKAMADPHHEYSFIAFDLVGIIEEWFATNIVKD